MNRNTLQLLNIITDLRRALMEYVRKENATYSNSTFLKNIVDNFPQLNKIDPNISKYIDIKYLKNDTDLPKVKAENLLMMANRLQSYLCHPERSRGIPSEM